MGLILSPEHWTSASRRERLEEHQQMLTLLNDALPSILGCGCGDGFARCISCSLALPRSGGLADSNSSLDPCAGGPLPGIQLRAAFESNLEASLGQNVAGCQLVGESRYCRIASVDFLAQFRVLVIPSKALFSMVPCPTVV